MARLAPLLFTACIYISSSLQVRSRQHHVLRTFDARNGNSKRIVRVVGSPTPQHVVFSQIKRTGRPQLFVSEDDENVESSGTSETRSKASEGNEVRTVERAEVLGYRSALVVASLGFAVLASISVFQGTGLATDILQGLQESSRIAIGWGSCLTALLAPPYRAAATDSENDDVLNAFLLFLNEALPTLGSFALMVELINTIQFNLANGAVSGFSLAPSENLDKAAAVFIGGVCFREILFYGVTFKIEAVLAIVFLIVQALDLGALSPDIYSLGLALSLLVLSFGKVFEPIRSDLTPDQSGFFLDGRKEREIGHDACHATEKVLNVTLENQIKDKS